MDYRYPLKSEGEIEYKQIKAYAKLKQHTPWPKFVRGLVSPDFRGFLPGTGRGAGPLVTCHKVHYSKIAKPAYLKLRADDLLVNLLANL